MDERRRRNRRPRTALSVGPPPPCAVVERLDAADPGFLERLTAESGILCVRDFRSFHEFAETLLGHPVWTHKFADEDIRLDLKVALAARDEGLVWRRRRIEGPVDSLMRLMKSPAVAMEKDGLVVVRRLE